LYSDTDINSIIKNFIDVIDKNNAATSIGTLEFLDTIAKYNTTKTVCSDNNTANFFINNKQYLKDNNFENIYFNKYQDSLRINLAKRLEQLKEVPPPVEKTTKKTTKTTKPFRGGGNQTKKHRPNTQNTTKRGWRGGKKTKKHATTTTTIHRKTKRMHSQ
jgi:hypothetical protein